MMIMMMMMMMMMMNITTRSRYQAAMMDLCPERRLMILAVEVSPVIRIYV